MDRRKFILSTTAAVSLVGLGGIYWKQRWHYIVIHHSAGNYGNIEFLQKVHKQRQAKDPIDAIPYHYVIGNGNGMELGKVESDWRQQNNIWGAHVSGNNSDRNFRGIGICLIGNFEKEQVPEEQYKALLKLTKELITKYNISKDNISGHGKTSGEFTKCPGKFFPFNRFYKDIT